MEKKRNIEPVVTILEKENERDDLKYWSGKTPEERIDAVLYLREQYMIAQGYASPPMIEPVVKIITP